MGSYGVVWGLWGHVGSHGVAWGRMGVAWGRMGSHGGRMGVAWGPRVTRLQHEVESDGEQHERDDAPALLVRYVEPDRIRRTAVKVEPLGARRRARGSDEGVVVEQRDTRG
eukprot:6039903-Prymnesium_polylepis.2